MHSLTSLEYQYYVQHHKNPLVRYGAKVFSQSDEDGITIEILRRLNLPGIKYYLELGCGDGGENNTLVLDALGDWQGRWIGGQDIATQHYDFTKAWITKDNVVSLAGSKQYNLISVDLDGNDWHIVRELLDSHYNPDVFILEYNAKFIPPTWFVMPYNAEHSWSPTTTGDYFGASLQSWVELLKEYDLVACNAATGANAFFVRKDHKFMSDSILTIRDIYVPPRYNYVNENMHQMSIHTMNYFLK